MTSSESLISTYINCGRHKCETTLLDSRSNIDQIHEQVRLLCGLNIPNTYCLVFYDCESKKMVKLNQNHLPNLFQSDSSIVNFVELFVLDTANEPETPPAISCHETMKETVSEQDLPIMDIDTEINNNQGEDLFNALLNKEQDEIDILMQHVVSNHHEEPSSNYPSEDQSSFLVDTSINDAPSDSLSNALLTDEQSVQNLLVNQDSSRPISTGVAMPLRANPRRTIQCQPSIELNESSHLFFSLDVKPEQRKIYRSDQFNQTNEMENNGYVTRIQGMKTSTQKMSSVWPKIRVPISFRNRRGIRLAVYAVSERSENGMRIWSKHRDKGFLPKDFTRHSLAINPIEFDVNGNSLTLEGDLMLDLPMTTLWEKLKKNEVIYRLDEQSTIDLHPAEHDAISPRLLCILRDDHQCFVNTLCLSGFIRSKTPSKQGSLPTVQTHPTVNKRLRTM